MLQRLLQLLAHSLGTPQANSLILFTARWMMYLAMKQPADYWPLLENPKLSSRSLRGSGRCGTDCSGNYCSLLDFYLNCPAVSAWGREYLSFRHQRSRGGTRSDLIAPLVDPIPLPVLFLYASH